MLLDKNQIILELDALNLPEDQYWVLMGGALVLHGLKDHTSDVDLGCTADLFATLVDKGYALSPSHSGHAKIRLSGFTSIYREWFADAIVFIEGVPTASISSVVQDKLRIGRPKDMDDIAMIKRSLDGQ